MNKKNITPNPTQPADRIPTGQLPSALAELSEDTLTSTHIVPASDCTHIVPASDCTHIVPASGCDDTE